VNKPQRWSPTESKLTGAVIGGTIQQGVLAVGDWIEIRPGRLTLNEKKEIVAEPLFTQVTEIRCEEQSLPYAVPGSLLAIQTTLDPSFGSANGMVGQVVGTPTKMPPIVGEISLKFRTLKRDIYPFGKASNIIQEHLKNYKNKIAESSPNMLAAANLALNDATDNEIILLSPACSSFDEFKNFEHRGDVFREWALSHLKDN
jgi:translation initiation factor 2 gamma subunit (eIF-2gamma)